MTPTFDLFAPGAPAILVPVFSARPVPVAIKTGLVVLLSILIAPVAQLHLVRLPDLTPVAILGAGFGGYLSLLAARHMRHVVATDVNARAGAFVELNKALNAIEKQNDPFIVVDLLNMIMNTKKVENINIEFACMLLKKAKILTESGYIIHIKTGLLFVSQAVSKYQNVPLY